MPSRIEIENIPLDLTIGCLLDERDKKQKIDVRLSINNYHHFLACKTDLLSDTLDVRAIEEIVKSASEKTQLHTLERLAQIIEQNLRAHFTHKGLQWELTLTKQRFSWKYVHSWST